MSKLIALQSDARDVIVEVRDCFVVPIDRLIVHKQNLADPAYIAVAAVVLSDDPSCFLLAKSEVVDDLNEARLYPRPQEYHAPDKALILRR